MDERPEQYVDFVSNVDGIIAIKRLRITEQTKGEEIGLALSAIRRIADRGICIELGIDIDALDAAANRIVDSVGNNTPDIDSNLTKSVHSSLSASIGKGAERHALRYLAASVLWNMKIPASVTEGELVKAYPELKKMVKIKNKKAGRKKRDEG
jgi:hypothetical protein